MLITCNNCSKKFDINSSLIPEKGRLLQCSSCNHKWFFQKEILNNSITPDIIDRPMDEVKPTKIEPDNVGIKIPKLRKVLDIQIKNEPLIKKTLVNKDINEVIDQQISISKNKNNFSILSLTIIFIISFVALIIILDTFQAPISKIVPNIEFILYNLYETINDIGLFFKDLI
tara:strand:- start:118 stop:633 length:516 start_codon:yes stop_codon:yes gene_type:complete